MECGILIVRIPKQELNLENYPHVSEGSGLIVTGPLT